MLGVAALSTTRKKDISSELLFGMVIFFVMFCIQRTYYTGGWLLFFIDKRFSYLNMALSFVLPALAAYIYWRERMEMKFIGRTMTYMSVGVAVTYVIYRLFIMEPLVAKDIHIMDECHLVCCCMCYLGVGAAMAMVKKKLKHHSIGFTAFYNEYIKGFWIVFVLLFLYIYFINRIGKERSYYVYMPVNLVPFCGEIKQTLQNFSLNGLMHLLGNVAYYTIFSVLVMSTVKKKKAMFGILIPVITSIVFEGVQYLFDMGDTDIDDVITNTIGALIGVLVYNHVIKKILRSKK